MFKKLIYELIDNASQMSFWNIIGCQPRCRYTQYSLKKIAESNFNALKYMTGQDDGATIEVKNLSKIQRQINSVSI